MRQKQKHRRIGVSILFVSLVILSGCMTISVTAEVRENETLETYEQKMEMNESVYELYNASATSGQYSSINESMMSEFNNSNINGGVNYTETTHGENRTIILRLKEYDPSDNDNITVKKENGSIIYEDQSFADIDSSDQSSSQSDSPTVKVNYAVTMPGEIQNSTADSEDGDTATWNMSSADEYRKVYAESEASSGFLDGMSGILPLVAGVIVVSVIGLVLFIWTR